MKLPEPGTRIGPYEVTQPCMGGRTVYAVIVEGPNTGVRVILRPDQWKEMVQDDD